MIFVIIMFDHSKLKKLSTMSSAAQTPRIHVIPESGLMDDVISVHVTGLPAGRDVTLAGLLDEEGKVFVSYAHYAHYFLR